MRVARDGAVSVAMTMDARVTDRPAPAAHASCRQGITIVDLDRTLTRRGTYSPFLLHAAAKAAPHRLLLIPAVLACMLAYRAGIIGRPRLKSLMQTLMMGRHVPRARVEALAASFADRVVATGLRPGARAMIARERSAGRLVVLATAAHRFYAEPIADRLGIAHVVATESVWHGDGLRPALVGDNCYGRSKLAAVWRYLGEIDRTGGRVHRRVYSDDASDLPIFEWSDEQIAVHPSRRLKRIARRRGWDILRL